MTSFRVFLLSIALIACAKPTTNPPIVSLSELSEEITNQAREEFRSQMERAERIQRIADSLLRASAIFCNPKDKERRPRFSYIDQETLAETDYFTRSYLINSLAVLR